MNILTSIEEMTKKFHPYIPKFLVTMCSSFIILLLMDIHYGYLSQIPIRSASGTGKMAGSMALLVGGMACLYYVLREAYVRSKRKGAFSLVRIENSIKKSIQIFRHIHPLCGILAFLLVFSHAYILWYVAGKTAFLAIYSGLFALITLGLVTAIGLYLIHKPNDLQLRKYHRRLTGVLIVCAVLHLIVV